MRFQAKSAIKCLLIIFSTSCCSYSLRVEYIWQKIHLILVYIHIFVCLACDVKILDPPAHTFTSLTCSVLEIFILAKKNLCARRYGDCLLINFSLVAP